MKKDPAVFLEHILECIEQINSYVGKYDETKFEKKCMAQDAVMRRLEIIGEAVKNLSSTFKKTYPDIPWKKVAGMRDILIHEYFGVNVKLVWKTVKENLPLFRKQINNLFDKINKDSPKLPF